VIAAVTLACASARVQPAVRGPFTPGSVRRLYVLVDHRAAHVGCVDYGEMLRQALREALAQQKVENESNLMATTEPDAHLAAIRAYSADLVLVVRATGGRPGTTKFFPKCGSYILWYDPLSYDVTVFNAALDMRVWHASASNSGGGTNWQMKKRFRKMAVAIVERLRQGSVF